MTGAEPAVEAAGLVKRFGRRRPAALDGCSFQVGAGSVCALVGPNGAGKSTLLDLAAGVSSPTEGSIRLLGGHAPGEVRERVSYLAQDKQLYPQLTVAETLRMAAGLNPGRWDARYAADVVEQGGVDPGTRVRRLSGGQRTRVALALALGKRPDLLLLDEPMAALDPLARKQFTGLLMAHVAEHGATVLLSSHDLGELTDTCDDLLLLGQGRVRLAGATDALLDAHLLATGRGTVEDLSAHTVVDSRAAGRGTTALLRPAGPLPDGWSTAQPSLEELVVHYLGAPDAPPLDLSAD